MFSLISNPKCVKSLHISGFFPAILGKGPWPKLGKMIDLTSKLGEIYNIDHNKGSKIYPQNQVILDCIMPSIPFKHKSLSTILIWVIFFFFDWEKQTWYWEKKVAIFN